MTLTQPKSTARLSALRFWRHGRQGAATGHERLIIEEGSSTMFWRRKQKKKRAVKRIEGDLFQHMVNRRHVPLEVLHNLRLVERDAEVGGKPVGLTMFRVFHRAATKEKDVTVDDYDSLDGYPELVLYEGYYQVTDGHAVNIRIEKKPEK